jgi:hypothetical protein
MEAKPKSTTAFAAFMAGLIDYAGMFPPARLPLAEALAHYGRYRQEPDAWMLGRFIIPAARLVEAAALLPAPAAAADEPPWSFAVLGRGGATVADFEAALTTDLEEMAAFRRQQGRAAILDAFEVRLPAAAQPDLADLQEVMARAAGMLAATERPPALFFEAPVSPDDADGRQQGVAAVIRALARHNETLAGAGNVSPAGFKLRCGGVTAAAFPTVAQVAFALVTCRDAGVPLKATAGLHHPLPRFDESVQATMHGFLNLFGAGILAHVHRLDQVAVESILADEEAAHFRFEPGAFTYQSAGRHLAATVPEIRHARQALLSYGSCSFDEPRADLRALGWLR